VAKPQRVHHWAQEDTRESRWRGCFGGLTAGGITSDAKIKGCLWLRDTLAEGDPRQNDLWGIWFEEDVFAYERQFSIDELGPS
jgi:hypothetical protein